jgi:hypothetical protein
MQIGVGMTAGETAPFQFIWLEKIPWNRYVLKVTWQ